MDKLKELLAKGFFPVQLPPGFTSESYANEYKKFQGRWEAQKAPDCRMEKFSVARSSYYRRVTRIVNPVGYFFLAKEITTYWSEIQKHYRKSKISLSIPQISPSLRAIQLSKFSELYEAKITKSTGYRYVLITDISTFFRAFIPILFHGLCTENLKLKELLRKTPCFLVTFLTKKAWESKIAKQ